MTDQGPLREPNLLDRTLRLFAPVRGGEGGTVLLMALNVFLLLTAYYIIKPVREALILAEWSAEAKIYSSAGQALLLLGVIPLTLIEESEEDRENQEPEPIRPRPTTGNQSELE